ncbi:hypothetical protein PIB30_073923, partial [Stylosanthes scabra]|nr:hypothetical protein [Stylosanthes scabra]
YKAEEIDNTNASIVEGDEDNSDRGSRSGVDELWSAAGDDESERWSRCRSEVEAKTSRPYE